ncbi:MAG: hypothetical protein ACFFD1_15390, partial [Candidatus Thorarchaeota archaeon]
EFFMKKLNRIATELPVHPLVDLGKLKVDGINNKITDLPGRSLYLEPQGTRKSWRRLIFSLLGLLSIIVSTLVGRVTSINQTFANISNIPWDVIFFSLGVLLIAIAYLMHPINERGIKIFDKDNDKYIIKTKTFSLFGKDQEFNLKRLFNLYAVRDTTSEETIYILQFKDGKTTSLAKIFIKKNDKNYESKNLTLKRFENRLEKYSGQKIKYISRMKEIESVPNEYSIEESSTSELKNIENKGQITNNPYNQISNQNTNPKDQTQNEEDI